MQDAHDACAGSVHVLLSQHGPSEGEQQEAGDDGDGLLSVCGVQQLFIPFVYRGERRAGGVSSGGGQRCGAGS